MKNSKMRMNNTDQIIISLSTKFLSIYVVDIDSIQYLCTLAENMGLIFRGFGRGI